MGTNHFAGLYYEETCYECGGKGYYDNGYHPMTGVKCEVCNGGKKTWRRWHYTHARTYEDALKKLGSRLSQWGSFPSGGRWLLVWKDRYTKKTMEVIDVTKGIQYRINKIIERRKIKELKRTGRMNLISRTIKYDEKGNKVSDTITNHITGEVKQNG